MIYGQGGTKELTKNIEVPLEDRQRFCLNDDEILELASFAVIIEDYYSKKLGHYMPMDIEWAKDGESGELFVVQSRPETVQSQRSKDVIETFVLEKRGKLLARGRSVGSKIASGKARVIKEVSDMHDFHPGENPCVQ